MRTAAIGSLALALGLGSVLACSAHNVVGELPDGGGGSTALPAGGGGTVAGASGSGPTGLAGAAGGGISGVAGGSIAPGGIPASSQIPRLTNAQYDRTVRDLLGVTTLAAPAAAGNRPSGLLATDSTAPLTDIGWNAYGTVAQMIAAQVMADPALRPRFLACTPTGDGTACLHDTVVSFGRRAFRRPLTTAEVARFDKIVAARAKITPTGAPEEVAEVLLETFLASPSFIQRSEISSTPDGQGHYVLAPYEVASRLAYLLWGSAPDDTLNQAADGGQLVTRAQIRAQAQRMLADARAREQVGAFHDYYLRGSYAWFPTGHDPGRFPAYTAAFAAAADAELARFFDAVTFDQQGSFESLLTSPLGFVTRDTAPTYGLDGAQYGTALTAVTLNAAQRPGFLTRVGFLSAISEGAGATPLQRGGYVVRKLLNLSLGEHPQAPGPPPAPTGGFATMRALVEDWTDGPDCSGCHGSYVNPPGFVLEAYDPIGAWRTTDPDTGAAIDTAVTMVLDGTSVSIKDPAQLMARLAASGDAQRTYARRLVSYAYEREEDPLDAATVDALAARIAGKGYPVVNLFVDLTQTDAFGLRVKVTP
jgi:hypothetical protein